MYLFFVDLSVELKVLNDNINFIIFIVIFMTRSRKLVYGRQPRDAQCSACTGTYLFNYTVLPSLFIYMLCE